ncbi:MAG: TVP38/TMEM64 family protein [Crocosphaera sp.]|nr:TVP38/TMEM64 family protein [Crocosphaera sp.]
MKTQLKPAKPQTPVNKNSTVHKTAKFLFLATLSLVISLFCLGKLNIFFDSNFWVDFIKTYQCCTIPIFIVAYIVLTVIGIPGTILTIVGGILFGLFWGTFWSVIGATVGALGAFLSARYCFKDYIQKRFNKRDKLSQFQTAILEQPMRFVLLVRFAPISPFNIVNFLFGLTSINWLSYTLGTFIGIIPGTFAYTWLGVSGIDALSGSDRLSFFLALGFLFFLSIIPFLMRNYSKSQSR